MINRIMIKNIHAACLTKYQFTQTVVNIKDKDIIHDKNNFCYIIQIDNVPVFLT